MRYAKIISYKVKGSFQHNCSMFAEKKDLLVFFRSAIAFAMILRVARAKNKKKTHISFRNNNFPHIIWASASEGGAQEKNI